MWWENENTSEIRGMNKETPPNWLILSYQVEVEYLDASVWDPSGGNYRAMWKNEAAIFTHENKIWAAESFPCGGPRLSPRPQSQDETQPC